MDAVALERIPGEREARAAIAEPVLKERAQVSGEEVGGGMRVAEVQDADLGAAGRGLQGPQLVEEGREVAAAFDADLGVRESELDALGDAGA
jgi:hypothetical protein